MSDGQRMLPKTRKDPGQGQVTQDMLGGFLQNSQEQIPSFFVLSSILELLGLAVTFIYGAHAAL